MSNIKVSVIVPVYNVEKYLRKCLDSLINQTLREIEIICVNDGSTDSSLQILGEYAQEDNRIKIFNKENGGLGAARNTGMEFATGEYIGFVDSDDWVDLTMYERLYKNAKSLNSEMVMCPLHSFDDITHEFKYDPYYTLECFGKNYDDRLFTHIETKNFFFNICVSAANKIYKVKFLDKIDAKFPEGLIFEDNPFFYKAYLNAKKVSLVRDFLYFYRINRDDSIVSSSNKKFMDVIKIHRLSRKAFLDTNNFNAYKNDLLIYIIRSIFLRYNLIDNEFKERFYELIKEDFENMDLSAEEIKSMSKFAQNKYLNVVVSDSYRKFEQLESEFFVKSNDNRLNGLEELEYYQKKLNCLQKKQLKNISRIRDLKKDYERTKKQLKIIESDSKVLEKDYERTKKQLKIIESDFKVLEKDYKYTKKQLKIAEKESEHIKKQLEIIANTKSYRFAYMLHRFSNEFLKGDRDNKKNFLKWVYSKLARKESKLKYKYNPIMTLIKK